MLTTPTSKRYGPYEYVRPQRELPLGFSFKVKLGNVENWFDFQSVSGLNREISTESIREGGQLYDYALPTKMQYGELVLKRGLWVWGAEGKDEFHKWLDLHSSGLMVHPKDILIMLVNPWNEGAVYYTWNIKNAWPKKWSISDFNAEENQVVIETLELHYDSFTVVHHVPQNQ